MKEINEPNFRSTKLLEQCELFDELKEFKKLASQAGMDEEREVLKSELTKEVDRK